MNYIHVSLLGIIMYVYSDMVRGSSCAKLESILYDDLLKMISKLKGTGYREDETQRKEIPAFGASTSIRRDLTPNEIVKFERVWTNIGNGYDPNTGVFTAPGQGVYHFSCSAMAHSKALRLHLYKNEMQFVSIYPGDTGVNMGTLNMVLELKKGDRVYIKDANDGNNSLYTEYGSNFSMFSGFMISQ